MANNEVRILVTTKDEASAKMQGIQMNAVNMAKGVAAAATGVAAAFAASAVTSGIAQFGKEIVSAASNSAESLNKMRVVFGETSAAVEAFAQNSARDFGLSNQKTLEYLGTFGNLLTSMELSRPLSAQMSEGIVQLAADLASFNNIPVDVALEKIRAGLVGEVEPLRAVGVNLNQATLEAEAFRMGLIKQGETMSAATKAQAAYAIITEQTKNAQGDFARTSDGLANQHRILTSQVEDLKAKMGEALLPVVLSVTSSMNELLANHGEEWAHAFAGGVDVLTMALKGAGNAASDMNAIFDKITGGKFWSTLMTGAVATFTAATLPARSALSAARDAIAPDFNVGGDGRPPVGGWNLINEELAAEWANEIHMRSPEKIAAPGLKAAGTGGKDPLTAAWERVQDQLRESMVKTWLQNGEEQAEIVREQNERTVAEVQSMAERIQQTLGVDMADAVTQAFEYITDREKAMLDARIKAAEDATEALMKQMDAEAELAKKRMEAMQSLLTTFVPTMGGGAAAVAFGQIAVGNNVSGDQLNAALAAANAATNNYGTINIVAPNITAGTSATPSTGDGIG